MLRNLFPIPRKLESAQLLTIPSATCTSGLHAGALTLRTPLQEALAISLKLYGLDSATPTSNGTAPDLPTHSCTYLCKEIDQNFYGTNMSSHSF